MKYGLIGEKLSHSYSREIHGMISDGPYELYEISCDKLEDFFGERNFSAINVTIPYKQSVIPLLDEISDSAKRIGAVNTVVNKGGKLYGYNTDYDGMRALLEHAKINIKGKTVAILGAGGTSKTARTLMYDLGAKEILVVSRRKQDCCITYGELSTRRKDINIIINATPVGMYPKSDEKPIELSDYPCIEGVADVIYNPMRTLLIQEAEKRNIAAEGGLYMLCSQAVFASALFRNVEVDNDSVNDIFEKLKRKKLNIVFVGMPTSGKSSVGRVTAQKLGREFLDTDLLFEKKYKKTPSEYIEEYGEKSFRYLESELIGSLADRTGTVIATGGGAVLLKNNIKQLKKNGIIVFLDRDFKDLLPMSDRPLSSTAEKLGDLYVKRYPIYCEAADITIKCQSNVEETAKNVLEKLYL